MRLDKVLLDLVPESSFGLIQKLCRKGQIRLDGKRCKANDRVRMNQDIKVPSIMLRVDDNVATHVYQLSDLERQEIDEMILFETDDFIAVNKTYGLPVQAGSGHGKSLDRMMVAYMAERHIQPKLIHRLDKTTTGCVLFAKNKPAASLFSKAFKSRQMEKTYWAIVYGKLKEKEGVISGSLMKSDDGSYEKMVVDEEGKKAETAYRRILSAGNYHWLEVQPRTGRTHQIRAHLAAIGIPIIGDTKYGGSRLQQDVVDIPRNKIFLHARQLSHLHENIHLTAEIPAHFEKLFSIFEWEETDGE